MLRIVVGYIYMSVCTSRAIYINVCVYVWVYTLDCSERTVIYTWISVTEANPSSISDIYSHTLFASQNKIWTVQTKLEYESFDLNRNKIQRIFILKMLI